MPDFLGVTSWSQQKLLLLRGIIVGCRCVAGISAFVAFIMMIRYFAGSIESPMPCALFVSSAIILFVSGEVLNILGLIAENTHDAAAGIADAMKRIDSLDKNVDEISTSLAEIADGVHEATVQQH